VDALIGWPGGDWQATARLAGLLIGGYFLILWFASVLWVYRDVRSRSHDPITHLVAVAIAVALPIVGLPVYFVLRPEETLRESYDRQLEQEAILSELHAISACPNCRRPVRDDFMVCAHCANPLRQPCTACGQLLQFSWRHCPYCATPRQQPQRAEPRLEVEEPPAMDLRRSERRATPPAGGSTAAPTQGTQAAARRPDPARPRESTSEAVPDEAPLRPRAALRARPRTDEGAAPR
jgi:hypothetical protein